MSPNIPLKSWEHPTLVGPTSVSWAPEERGTIPVVYDSAWDELHIYAKDATFTLRPHDLGPVLEALDRHGPNCLYGTLWLTRRGISGFGGTNTESASLVNREGQQVSLSLEDLRALYRHACQHRSPGPVTHYTVPDDDLRHKAEIAVEAARMGLEEKT